MKNETNKISRAFFELLKHLPAHNFRDGAIWSWVREHELDLAFDSGLLGHLGVVDEGSALVAAGRDITGGYILQTFLKSNMLHRQGYGRYFTDDGGFPAPILAQDESQGGQKLNVLSITRPGAEGSDPLDLHLADLRHFTAQEFRLA